MAKNPTPAKNTTTVSLAAPTPSEFADMRSALLNQLEDDLLVGSWWRRVRDARKREDWQSLKLAYAEAKNRLDHSKRKTGMAVLRTLFKLLGVRI